MTIGSDSFRVEGATARRPDRGGVHVTMQLAPRPGTAAAGLTATRTAEAYPGIAGFRTQTTLHAIAPLALSGVTLDEAAAGDSVRTTIHSFRAGADWREPDWPGPPPGSATTTPAPGGRRAARRGRAARGPGRMAHGQDGPARLTMVAERNDLPSSRAAYDGTTAKLQVDWTKDVISLGPFEENAHVENPGSGAGRARTIAPGASLALEPAWTGFGTGGRDDAWQFHKQLTRHRLAPYRNAVTFNSNGTDRERDLDRRQGRHEPGGDRARRAHRAGDWASRRSSSTTAGRPRSGDWEPDSPEHPEPRWDGLPGSKFAPRFPDARFEAVRRAIAPMELGLWMSPASFNPRARAYREHPEWACAPLGHGLAAYNLLQPDDGSNEAGIGAWGPAAWPHVEQRIRTAITEWGVRYFKFDFLLWLDCAGQGDLYEYHDAFVAMLDRIQRDHPDVTFQIDETNDYRLFPFESVARGPSWFQNGSPPPEQLLHNLWNLSPYVPAFSLGQHFLGGKAWSATRSTR